MIQAVTRSGVARTRLSPSANGHSTMAANTSMARLPSKLVTWPPANE